MIILPQKELRNLSHRQHIFMLKGEQQKHFQEFKRRMQPQEVKRGCFVIFIYNLAYTRIEIITAATSNETKKIFIYLFMFILLLQCSGISQRLSHSRLLNSCIHHRTSRDVHFHRSAFHHTSYYLPHYLMYSPNYLYFTVPH